MFAPLAALLSLSPGPLVKLIFGQTDAAAALALTDDPAKLAQILIDGVAAGNWWLIVAPALTLLIWAVRTYGPKLFPKAEGFLTHPVVSFALPVVIAILGGLITAAIAGPMSGAIVLGIVLAGLKVAAGSITTYVGAKKVAEAREAKAEAKAQAETKVDSVPKAVDELNKP